MTDDHTNLLAAIDSGDRLALHLLADWYEDHESDLGAGLRWILRWNRKPVPVESLGPVYTVIGHRWWGVNNWKVTSFDLPMRVFYKLQTDRNRGSCFIPGQASAAYLDAARAAVAALRSCCGQLWGEGEACGECGESEPPPAKVLNFYPNGRERKSQVEVAPLAVRKSCKHEWRRRAYNEESSGWRSVCRRCGACRRGGC